MADIYVKSGGGTIGTGSYRGNWTAAGVYAAGDRVCGVTVSDYWIFECTTGGTAGATEPTWVKTDGSTTTDNTVTWTARIPSTWADATLTLAKASANDVVGDTIYVAHDHNETTSGSVSLSWSGTSNNPTKIISVNSGATPPVTVTNTSQVTVGTPTFGSLSIGGSTYIEGIRFTVGAGNNTNNLDFFSATVVNNCQITIAATSTSAQIRAGAQSQGFGIKFLNVFVKFSAAGGITVDGGVFSWVGGGILPGGTSPTALIAGTSGNNRESVCTLSDLDLSNAAAAIKIFTAGVASTHKANAVIKNSKLPTSWSGTLINGSALHGERFSMYNCDSTSTNYRLWIETYSGSIKSETTIVKTGGATDGTTPLSWKLVTNANVNELVAPLITDDMARWIDTTGASKTITVDILHDSLTALTDAEIWLEIDYLGSSATPLGTPTSDKRATVLTTAVAQPTSTASWTTTGLTNPNYQKLEVTFIPQMIGFVYARVCLAKPSYTVYVNPQPSIS
jgi:hypothetical protein